MSKIESFDIQRLTQKLKASKNGIEKARHVY